MSSKSYIKPSEIQNELDRIEKAHDENRQQRAALFNLIVYAFESERLPYFVELSDLIAKQFPCRIIFIKENPKSEEKELKTQVQVKLLENESDKTVICEQITVEAPESLNQNVFPLVLPHLLPDLPIYLVWAKDPTEPHPAFEPFKKLAHRLIFESECSNNLQSFAEKIQSNILKSHWEVADLNWARLESWRSVLLNLFNNEKRLQDLKELKKITLRYQGSESEYFCHNHFQVHYLHGWLAAQLGWTFKSLQIQKNLTEIIYQTGSRQIQVLLETEKKSSSKTPGEITYAQFITESKLKFQCVNDPDQSLIKIEISDEEKPEEIYNSFLMHAKWEYSLAREICYQNTSAHYCAMLGVLSTLKGLV